MASGIDDDAQRLRDSERLAALEGRLEKIRTPEAPATGALGETFDQANMAWRMVIELVAGLILGFGIGYGLDWLFGTRPILLVLFTLAGVVAGIKTMMRTAREMGGTPGQAGGAAVLDDDDEDEGH